MYFLKNFSWYKYFLSYFMIAKKRKLKSPSRIDISPIVFMVLMVIFLSFLVISNFKVNQERTNMVSEIQKLQNEINRLEQEKANLETGISRADEDIYWEERARDQGFVKEGENPVVVLPPEESSGESGEFGKEAGILQRFFETIKNFLRE